MEINQKTKGPLDIRSLKEAGEFTIIFDNDKGIKCQLIAADNYNLLVSDFLFQRLNKKAGK